MHAKTKALLVSVLLLPTTVMATDGNAPPQNRQQLQIEQIQDETALYEAMLAREKIRHELRTLELGVPASRRTVWYWSSPASEKPCDHESGRRNRRLSVPEG